MNWTNDTVRALERKSIREFMERNAGFLSGRVLDFGAGKQPYKDLVTGEYLPHEDGECRIDGPFDAIVCNQVLQYISDPRALLFEFVGMLASGGYLVMTYPTNWDEVEQSDLWRFTKRGMEALLTGAGLKIITHERRAEIDLNGFKFPLGYGVVAQRPGPTP